MTNQLHKKRRKTKRDVKMYRNINAERARNGLSVAKLAEKLGIGVRTYYSWQKNGKIPASKLIQMSKLFNCSVDYLLGQEQKAETYTIKEA